MGRCYPLMHVFKPRSRKIPVNQEIAAPEGLLSAGWGWYNHNLRGHRATGGVCALWWFNGLTPGAQSRWSIKGCSKGGWR